MMRPTRLLTALAYCACVTLSACGGGSSSSSDTAATAAPVASTASSSNTSSSTTSTTSAFSLSGVVSGVPSATVATAGTASLNTATDSSGNFSFASLAAGSYTVAPTQAGYIYIPVSRVETITTASITDVTFAATAATAATYTVSGTVSGSVVAGVTMTLNGTNVGSALTDAGGNYSFAGLASGTYTLTATLNGYSFSAPRIVALGTTDSTGNNFTAGAQPSDGIEFTAASTLPQATVGVPYSGTVVQTISGGTAPYHYQAGLLDDGTPPLGMIVNPNGNVTGTATVAGLYVFNVCAVDATGATSTCEPTSLTVVTAPSATPVQISTPAPLPTVTLTASPASTAAGAGSTLTWSSTNATVCTASGGWSGTKGISGSVTVSPTSSTMYTLACAGTGGASKSSVLVSVAIPAAPSVTLTASATTITAGAKSTLKWSSKNANVCTGTGGWSGNQGTSGSFSVAPTSTTTYGLSCSGSAGAAKASTKITVNAATNPTPAPAITLTANPTTITAGADTTLTWSSQNTDSCTAISGASGAVADSGTASLSPTATTTYTLSCSGAGGTTQASAKVTVNGAVTSASGTSWVYYDGIFDWPGDFDFAAVANYSDTSGAPLSGSHDIMMTSSPYGGWLPYAQNWDFNSAPYTKLTFSLKPTRAGQTWQAYFVKVGDVPVGITINVSEYGPTPVAGQWGTYTIPLSVLGVLGQPIYKFAIQDQSGASGNVWYIDNVGFVP